MTCLRFTDLDVLASLVCKLSVTRTCMPKQRHYVLGARMSRGSSNGVRQRQDSAFFAPCEILFTQSSIKDAFQNGLSLEDTALQLASKEIPKRNVEMISVVWYGGEPHSLDNRRLAVFRLLQFVGKCSRIKVKVVRPDPHEWRRKFDAHAAHTSILVRGSKYIIASTAQATTFPLSRIRAATAYCSTEGLEFTDILAMMDSDDEEPLGRRPAQATQQRDHRVTARKKNAADQRRGKKSTGQLVFTEGLQPFAAGKSRFAYRCRAQGGCVAGFTDGSYLVLKSFKPGYHGVSLSPKDADTQDRVAALAQAFNEEVWPTQNSQPCCIHVRDAAVVQLNRSHTDASGSVVLQKGQNALLEREIFGEFRKFNSNNGWTSKTGSDIPSAFSHWSWAEYGELVCDLQGYQGRPPGPKYLGSPYYYLLTDPAIMSPSGRYGITDLGQAGIENWFAVHECNDICRSLRIDRRRPAYRRPTQAVESSSSYRETDNAHGPRQHQNAVCALVAIVEGDDEYEDSSSDYW